MVLLQECRQVVMIAGSHLIFEQDNSAIIQHCLGGFWRKRVNEEDREVEILKNRTTSPRLAKFSC